MPKKSPSKIQLYPHDIPIDWCYKLLMKPASPTMDHPMDQMEIIRRGLDAGDSGCPVLDKNHKETLAYSKLTSWLIDIPTIPYHKPSQSPINIMNNWLEIPTTSPIIYPDIARNRPDIAWNIMKYHHNIPIDWCFILHLNIIKTDENSTTIVHPHPRNLHSDALRLAVSGPCLPLASRTGAHSTSRLTWRWRS